MDTTLTIQLFWFATAVPVALEAYKAQGRAHIILWTVAVAFGLMGFIWPALSIRWPAIQELVADLATNPSAWFAIAVTLFFVLRPYWTRPPTQGKNDISKSYDDRPLRKAVDDLQAEHLRTSEILDAVHDKITIASEAIEASQAPISDLQKSLRSLEPSLRAQVQMALGKLDVFQKAVQRSLYVQQLIPRLDDLAREQKIRTGELMWWLERGKTMSPAEWATWSEGMQGWEQGVRQLQSDFEEFYTDDFFIISDGSYDAEWPILRDQAPTADAHWKLKRFLILSEKWDRVVKQTKDRMVAQAYDILRAQGAVEEAERAVGGPA